VTHELCSDNILILSIPMAVRSKAYVCGRSIVGITCSNPVERIEVHLLLLLCVV
jgi:hypothetical protein